jgi:subtilisin-like proprotein convertase family protein
LDSPGRRHNPVRVVRWGLSALVGATLAAMCVMPGTAGAVIVDNGNGFVIPATGEGPGSADPYPRTIQVSGVAGAITHVQLRWTGLSHTFPDDVDVLVVGPHGQKVMLMSDAGGSGDLSGVDLVFDDDAAGQLPDATQISAGTYKPTNYAGNDGANDSFSGAGAPPPPYGTSLSVFNGTDPNGTWSFYVYDDNAGEKGQAFGWRLRLDTTQSLSFPSAGPVVAAPYPSTIPVSGRSGTVTHARVTLSGIDNARGDDLDVLLVGPGGQNVLLMSDNGDNAGASGQTLTFDDAASSQLADDAGGFMTPFDSGTYKPSNGATANDGPNDSFVVPPAPGPPYGNSLGVFNATNPNGNWKLYANDDEAGPGFQPYGSIYGWSLDLQTSGNQPSADTSAPIFTGRASANPAAFEIKKSGKAETPVSGAKKGTTFRYSLSEAAAVTFTIQRKLKGRKVGRKCKKPTRRNRSRRRCARYKRAGAFRQQAVAGRNSKAFSGRIGRKSLRPGRYRALLVATDATGNKSKSAKVAFRVLKHKRRR